MAFTSYLALPLFGPPAAPPGPTDDSPSNPDPSSAEEDAFQRLLDQFRVPGVPPPPSSRVDPALRQRPVPPLVDVSLGGLWRYGAFMAQKTTDILADLVSHHLWGPRKKSWGIQMTLLSAIMRNLGTHSQLANIDIIRFFMALSGMLPPSADALVTPLTFRVRRRGLRGILRKWDEAEDGRREITAEWVVSKGLWRRMQGEWRRAKDREREGKGSTERGVRGRVLLYLHGGAYYVFNAATHRPITIPLSRATDSRVFAINYRLAPETRFPGPLHDAVSAYLRLIEDVRVPPENILVAGDSAGGGLALAMVMYLRDEGYPLPSGLILFSPWVDLTMSCDSWDSNAPYDVVPLVAADSHLHPVACYLGEAGLKEYLTHPYASPLFGEMGGLPPMLVQCGEAEVLRDEGTLLAHKAARAGVQVKHEIYEDAVHVFQMFPFLPQTAESFVSVREFARSIRAKQKRTSAPLDDAAMAQLARETENDASKVVSGDGEEVAGVAGGVEGVEEELAKGDSGSEKGSDTPVVSLPDPNPPEASSSVPPLPPKLLVPPSSSPTGTLSRRHTRHPTVSYGAAAVPIVRKRALSHPDVDALIRDLEERAPIQQRSVLGTAGELPEVDTPPPGPS